MDFKKVAKGLGEGIASVGKGAHDAVERYGNWVQETNKRLEEERRAAGEGGDEPSGGKSGTPSVKSLESITSPQKEMIFEAVGYRCEKCRKTFKDKPHYLEIHQVDLSDGAEPENLLVVCSFCHRDLDTMDDPASQFKYLDNRIISVNKKIGVILQSINYSQKVKQGEPKKQSPFGFGGDGGGFGSKPIDLSTDSVQKYMEKNYLFGKKEEEKKPDPKEDKPVLEKKKSPPKKKQGTPQKKTQSTTSKKDTPKKVRGSPKDLIGHKLTKAQLNVAKEKGHVYIQHNGKNVKVVVGNINSRTGEIKK